MYTGNHKKQEYFRSYEKIAAILIREWLIGPRSPPWMNPLRRPGKKSRFSSCIQGIAEEVITQWNKTCCYCSITLRMMLSVLPISSWVTVPAAGIMGHGPLWHALCLAVGGGKRMEEILSPIRFPEPDRDFLWSRRFWNPLFSSAGGSARSMRLCGVR